MQAEMLDSAISNSLQLFADKGFRVRVIMRCGEPWFVAKDVAACIDYKDPSTMVRLCRERDKYVASASYFDSTDLAESGNSRITLISESGLYRIFAKCNLPKCEPFESWIFDEVLPSIHKTGGYSVQSTFSLPKTLPEALRAYADEVERREAAEKRALTAESELSYEKETHEKDNEDFRNGLEILNAQKAQISSKREATAMATASAKSRECERLTNENAELKDAVGRGSNWRTVAMMKSEWIREFGHAPVWQKLKQFSDDVHIEPVKDVEERVILPNGREKINLSFRYHREAWARYRKYEENLRVTDIEIENV